MALMNLRIVSIFLFEDSVFPYLVRDEMGLAQSLVDVAKNNRIPQVLGVHDGLAII